MKQINSGLKWMIVDVCDTAQKMQDRTETDEYYGWFVGYLNEILEPVREWANDGFDETKIWDVVKPFMLALHATRWYRCLIGFSYPGSSLEYLMVDLCRSIQIVRNALVSLYLPSPIGKVRAS
jgi:hypothetical protein